VDVELPGAVRFGQHGADVVQDAGLICAARPAAAQYQCDPAPRVSRVFFGRSGNAEIVRLGGSTGQGFQGALKVRRQFGADFDALL